MQYYAAYFDHALTVLTRNDKQRKQLLLLI